MEPNNNDTGKLIRNLGLFIGIPLVCFLVISLFWGMRPTSEEPPYSPMSTISRTTRWRSFR